MKKMLSLLVMFSMSLSAHAVQYAIGQGKEFVNEKPLGDAMVSCTLNPTTVKVGSQGNSKNNTGLFVCVGNSWTCFYLGGVNDYTDIGGHPFRNEMSQRRYEAAVTAMQSDASITLDFWYAESERHLKSCEHAMRNLRVPTAFSLNRDGIFN